MSSVAKRLESLFSNEIIRSLQNADFLDIAQLNAAIALLIKLNLPFELSFKQGTNTGVPTAQLVITLTPTSSVTFLLPFDRGPVFT